MSNETPGYLAELLAEVLGYVLDLAVWIGGPYAVFVFWSFLCALFALCILLPFVCMVIWVAGNRRARLDRIYDRSTYPGTGPHETNI